MHRETRMLSGWAHYLAEAGGAAATRAGADYPGKATNEKISHDEIKKSDTIGRTARAPDEHNVMKPVNPATHGMTDAARAYIIHLYIVAPV
jgi:hypothetical protein